MSFYYINKSHKHKGLTNEFGYHYDNRYIGRTDPYTGDMYDEDNRYIGRKSQY